MVTLFLEGNRLLLLDGPYLTGLVCGEPVNLAQLGGSLDSHRYFPKLKVKGWSTIDPSLSLREHA